MKYLKLLLLEKIRHYEDLLLIDCLDMIFKLNFSFHLAIQPQVAWAFSRKKVIIVDA